MQPQKKTKTGQLGWKTIPEKNVSEKCIMKNVENNENISWNNENSLEMLKTVGQSLEIVGETMKTVG